MQAELERLRQALDLETGRRLELERQLVRLNGEFEEFISRAAHDVREPLRDIAAFSQLLAESCAESGAAGLEANTAEYLAHIRQGAARIESLTSAVVEYWTPTGDYPLGRADMEAVLHHALLVENRKLLACGATVTQDPLPPVKGNFELLTKVLRHLLRNAIEYAGPATPTIHISCQRPEPSWVFSVADNGPGIDPSFHERIFGTFKRLHGRERPGNGLGLAFCRKAIAWHGGRIWVDSQAGAGSTFYFTLHPVD